MDHTTLLPLVAYLARAEDPSQLSVRLREVVSMLDADCDPAWLDGFRMGLAMGAGAIDELFRKAPNRSGVKEMVPLEGWSK